MHSNSDVINKKKEVLLPEVSAYVIVKIEMIKNRSVQFIVEDMFYVQFVILFNNIKNVFTLRLEMEERKCRSLSRYIERE